MTPDPRETERATIGVDGNCGFALLGADLQEGEAEFVEIACDEPKWTLKWEAAATRAATKAYTNLKARLPHRTFSYRLGKSHPRYL